MNWEMPTIAPRFRWASFAAMAVLVIVAVPLPAAEFMISVIGDQEDLTKDEALVPGFIALTKWTADNRAANNIVFLTHAGDIVGDATDPPDRNLVQWRRADSAFDVLDTQAPGLPYTASEGNHDIESTPTPPGKPTRFYEFFGDARYENTSWYLGSSPGGNSQAQVFWGGDREYLHLNIQWSPSEPIWDWAEKLLDLLPEMPTIVTTHFHMEPAPSLQRSVVGQGIFQRLAEPYSQTFLLLGGHLTGVGRKTSQNLAGEDVFEVLADYENLIVTQNENWMRTIEIDDEAGTLQFRTLTPGMDPNNPVIQYMTDPENEFQYSLDWSTRFLPLLAEHEWVPAGGGNWATGTNWSQGTSPDSDMLAVRFSSDGGEAAVVDVTQAVVVANLRFDTQTDYEIRAANGLAALQLDAADRQARVIAENGNHTLHLPVEVVDDKISIDVRGTATLNMANAFDMGGHEAFKIGPGTLSINGGAAAVNGTLEILSGTVDGAGYVNGDLEVTSGAIDPGNGTGRLDVHGNLILRGNGQMHTDLSGRFGNNDLLFVHGDAQLDGKLEIDLTSGFFPAMGQQFIVLTANTVADTGLELTGQWAPYFNLQVNATTVVVESQLNANSTWTSNGFGAWTDLDNWSSVAPVTAEQTAIFGNATSVPSTVIVDTPVTVNAMTLDHSLTYVIAGAGSVTLDATVSGTSPTISVNQGAHQLQVLVNLLDDTTLNVAADAAIDINNQLNLNGNTLTKTGNGSVAINHVLNTAGGTFACQQGNCSGSGAIAGDLSVGNALLSPGNSPGVLTVTGDFLLDAEGTLLLEIAGNTPGSEYDILAIGGQADVAGALQVALLGEYQPDLGDHFDLLDFESLSGVFSNVALPELTAGRVWDTSGLYRNGTITVVAVPEPSALILGICMLGLLAPNRRWGGTSLPGTSPVLRLTEDRL